MRCCSCNDNLTDKESTRKDKHGKYLDLCDSCYFPIKYDVDTDVNPVFIYEDETEDMSTRETDGDY